MKRFLYFLEKYLGDCFIDTVTFSDGKIFYDSKIISLIRFSTIRAKESREILEIPRVCQGSIGCTRVT